MELGRVDLNLLIALDALLTERNVSRAAKRMGLTQSATSVQLRRLRAVFGDELLVRMGREYHLTPTAEHLIEPLAETLRSIERMVEYRPGFDPSTARRVFRIGTNDALEFLVIKPLLQELQTTAPGISLEVHPFAGAQTFDLIETGNLDLGMHRIETHDAHLVEQHLYTDGWIGVASADNDAVGDSLTFEQFQALPNAIYNWAWQDRTRMLRNDYDFFEDVPWRLADNSHFLRLFMLAGTNIVTLTYEGLARAVCEQASLKLVPLLFEIEPLRFGMQWHPRNSADPAHEWLRQRVAALASGLGTSTTVATARGR